MGWGADAGQSLGGSDIARRQGNLGPLRRHRGTQRPVVGSNGGSLRAHRPQRRGKTTLFNVVSRISTRLGRLSVEGQDLLSMQAHEISTMGCSGHPDLALWPRMSVIENVIVGIHTRSQADLPHRDARPRPPQGGAGAEGGGVRDPRRPRTRRRRVPTMCRVALRHPQTDRTRPVPRRGNPSCSCSTNQPPV